MDVSRGGIQMSRSLKYHAELDFGHGRCVRFTSLYLDNLLKRFGEEVALEEKRKKEAREYTYTTPNLIVEVCSSWRDFDQYEHADGRSGMSPLRKQSR
jgi:hypothetical protein